jgi:hypothetical protein
LGKGRIGSRCGPFSLAGDFDVSSLKSPSAPNLLKSRVVPLFETHFLQKGQTDGGHA